jgi:hypothetical protein
MPSPTTPATSFLILVVPIYFQFRAQKIAHYEGLFYFLAFNPIFDNGTWTV